MELISNILLGVGALGAAFYCFVLSRRLKRFSTLENGMGGAIAVLSAQVDDMTKALDRARGAATGSASALESLNARAEAAAGRLELLLASMHDLPEPNRDPNRDVNSYGGSERKIRFVRRRTPRDDLEAAE
jgi:hypothetical protein